MMLIRTTQLLAFVSICFCVTTLVAQERSNRYLVPANPASFGLQDEDGSTGVETPRQERDPSVLENINPLRKPMVALSVDVREYSSIAPQDNSIALTNSKPDSWSTFAPAPVGVAWAAPNIRYQPLFFENVPLERYGQTKGPWREVAASSVHFFGSLALWPYHGRFDHVRDCDYPLGFCRPGNYVPGTKQLQFWGW